MIPRKGFRFASNCTVTLSDRSSGSLNDVKPGDRITIIYGCPSGFPMAYRIGEGTPHVVSALNPPIWERAMWRPIIASPSSADSHPACDDSLVVRRLEQSAAANR